MNKLNVERAMQLANQWRGSSAYMRDHPDSALAASRAAQAEAALRAYLESVASATLTSQQMTLEQARKVIAEHQRQIDLDSII